MNSFRHLTIRYVFLIVTGVTFLNMSFFAAEVSLLNLSKDDKSIATVIKILQAGGFEEESEHSDNHGKFESAKGIDLYFNLSLYHHNYLYLIAQRRFGPHNTLVPLSAHLKIFSPPPEA